MINIPKKKTHEQYVQEVQKINKNIEVLEKYVNSNIKILHKCKICNNEWTVLPNNILKGRECPVCAIEKIKQASLLSYEEYLQKVYNRNCIMIPIEKYIDSHTSILHQCKKCGYKHKVSPNRILSGQGCPRCNKKIRYTTETFLKEFCKVDGSQNIQINSEYINNKTPLQCECKICGYKWSSKGDALLRGTGCKRCKDSHTASLKKKSHDDFILQIVNINSDINILSKYKTSYEKVQCKCNVCGNVWSALPSNLLKGSSCPLCTTSHGEDKIRRHLSNNKISFISQKTFNDLKGLGSRALSYDFYLPEYNLLIEFQGKQHEKPIEHFGGEEKFKIQKEHDGRKRDYAKQNNINLLEIWYYDMDNIEEILTKTISNLKSKSVETVISA